MKGHISVKLGVVCVILSTLILASVLVQAQEEGNIEKDIIVSFPKPNQRVFSPMVTKGKARGPWFFEASFPIRLIDAQGNQLATSNGKALGDWMTKNFVPFEGEVEFAVNKATKAKLILENANPSGNPQNAKKKEIPVILVPMKK